MELIPGSKAARKGVVYGRNELVQRVMESTRSVPTERVWDGDLSLLIDSEHPAGEAQEGWEAVVMNGRYASAKPPY